MVRRTGLQPPATHEPGPTEVGPIRPTIILTRKRCGNASHIKKPLARLCAYVVSGGCNPDTRFMRCGGNVTWLTVSGQAVFLCVHDVRSNEINWGFIRRVIGSDGTTLQTCVLLFRGNRNRLCLLLDRSGCHNSGESMTRMRFAFPDSSARLPNLPDEANVRHVGSAKI